jgi:hypothetical protein
MIESFVRGDWMAGLLLLSFLLMVVVGFDNELLR